MRAVACMTSERIRGRLSAMSKTAATPSRPSTSPPKKTKAPSASRGADKETRKGRPLTAESPKERSPRQENL